MRAELDPVRFADARCSMTVAGCLRAAAPSLTTLVFLIAFVALAVGCGDNLPAVSVDIESPARGTSVVADSITVSGVATGPEAIARVSINGVLATVDDDGRFSAQIALEPGLNIIETIARGFGGVDIDRRAVLSGQQVAGPSSGVIVHMGVRGMANLAEDLTPTIDMAPIYTTLQSTPIKESGADCTLDVVNAASISTPVAKLFMYALPSGLGGEILFSPMELSASADYMDSACMPQTGSFGFETLELHWTYDLGVSLASDGEATVDVSTTVTLYDHELFYVNNDIEAAVFDRVSADLHLGLEAQLPTLTAVPVADATEAWFNSFNREEQTAPGELSVSHALASVEAGAGRGLLFEIATDVSDAMVVRTPTEPPIPAGSDAGVAISDDAINQVLAGAWRRGVFDVDVAGVSFRMMLPPTIAAKAGTAAEIIIGDWVGMEGEKEVVVGGSISLVAGRDESALFLGVGGVGLEPASGSFTNETIEQLEVLLDQRVRQLVQKIRVPIAALAARETALFSRDGYLEISIDLDAAAP